MEKRSRRRAEEFMRNFKTSVQNSDQWHRVQKQRAGHMGVKREGLSTKERGVRGASEETLDCAGSRSPPRTEQRLGRVWWHSWWLEDSLRLQRALNAKQGDLRASSSAGTMLGNHCNDLVCCSARLTPCMGTVPSTTQVNS
jgi:hypothetical protein